MALEPQTLTLDALRDAPVPEFITRDPFVLKQFYVDEFEKLTGRKLFPAQTEMFVIEVMAYAKSIMGEAIQTAFLQNRAVWAEGRHLDELGANVSTFRLLAQTANCRVKFTLSMLRNLAIVIPAGTRVSAGNNLIFSTQDELVIPAGNADGEVDVVANIAGAEFNALELGQISDLLDPIAYVASVENVIASAGGSDIETDDRFRVRVVNAFERISKAGPRAGYVEHVKAVNPSIVDVAVIKPQPGYIEITPLMLDGVSADAVDQAVLGHLDPETIVPMGDYITIVKAVEQPFDLVMTVRVNGDGAGMQEKAEKAATDAFYPWTQSLGAQIAPSLITSAVKAITGVIDCDGPAFAFTDLPAIKFASINLLNINIVEAQMSDLKPLVPDALLPPGVKDERQQAFVRMLDAGLRPIDLNAFVMNDAYKVDARLLPYMAREFAVHKFIEPDMADFAVRNFIAHSYEIHAKMGYIEGVRLCLDMMGASAEWTQWWEEQPKAAHNTHKVKVYFDQVLFDGSALGDKRHQNAVTKIIEITKRWSQSVAVTFGVLTRTTMHLGAISSYGGRYIATLVRGNEPAHPANVFVGAACASGGTFTAGFEV